MDVKSISKGMYLLHVKVLIKITTNIVLLFIKISHVFQWHKVTTLYHLISVQRYFGALASNKGFTSLGH